MADVKARFVIGTDADLSGTKQVGKAMDDLGKKSRDLVNKMAMLGAAAVAAGAAMAAALVKSGIDAIDSQAKLARSIGSTIDGLRGLQLAAGEAGVESGSLSSAMKQLNARLGEAQRGTGEAKKALDMLGLSASALSKMDVDQRMATIADRVKELGLSTSQTADVLRNFGIRGGEMVDMLRQGGDAIRAAREDVDAFGLSISAVDAAKVEMANDAMERIKLTFEAIRNRITVAVAPILKVLADKFNDISKANKGFGDQAVQAFDKVMTWAGKVADAFHGLRVVIKGIQLVGEGAWAALVSGAQIVAEIFTRLADGINVPINAAIRGINALGANIAELPSLNNSEFMKGFATFADEARDRVGTVREELHNLAMQEMPSEKITRFLEDVKAKAQEAAEAVVGAQSGDDGSFDSSGGQADKEAERRANELERYREALGRKLESLQEFLLAEDELEIKRHEERLMTLSESLAMELVTVEEARATMEELEEEHMKRLADIRKKGWSDIQKFQNATLSQQVNQVSGYLADITAGVARENKAMFELNKAAGIANAIVAAYEGISKTLGAYPYPINIALAAAHAAAAFAQVSAIKNQSFSSGGSAAPSLAGGTPATPVTPVTGGTPSSGGGGGGVLTVEGIDESSIFTGRTIRALAERLAEHVRDGGTVQFA